MHDARYPTRTELSTLGTINTLGNPVDWSKLTNVPAAIADGNDQDTQYTAGTGLSVLSGFRRHE